MTLPLDTEIRELHGRRRVPLKVFADRLHVVCLSLALKRTLGGTYPDLNKATRRAIGSFFNAHEAHFKSAGESEFVIDVREKNNKPYEVRFINLLQANRYCAAAAKKLTTNVIAYSTFDSAYKHLIKLYEKSDQGNNPRIKLSLSATVRLLRTDKKKKTIKNRKLRSLAPQLMGTGINVAPEYLNPTQIVNCTEWLASHADMIAKAHEESEQKIQDSRKRNRIKGFSGLLLSQTDLEELQKTLGAGDTLSPEVSHFVLNIMTVLDADLPMFCNVLISKNVRKITTEHSYMDATLDSLNDMIKSRNQFLKKPSHSGALAFANTMRSFCTNFKALFDDKEWTAKIDKKCIPKSAQFRVKGARQESGNLFAIGS